MPDAPLLVLIGPAATGKSTVGTLVAERLQAPFIDIDELGDAYYEEVGWSVERLAARSAQVGRVTAEREWEPARAHAVRRVIEDHPRSVIALGAGHTTFVDPTLTAQVHTALSAVLHVVLILPAADRDQALEELRRRSLAAKGTTWVSDGHDFLAEWLDNEGNRRLATTTVITNGEAPTDTARRISELIAASTH